MSATALVVIVYVFYKILNTHNTLEISMSFNLYASIVSITLGFSLKTLGQKEQGESVN